MKKIDEADFARTGKSSSFAHEQVFPNQLAFVSADLLSFW
jgi:hypothetical protein